MTGYGILALFVLIAGVALIVLCIIFLVSKDKRHWATGWTTHPVKTAVTLLVLGVILIALAIGEFIVTG